jgi:chemotaxis protein methyltransferase CheR
MSRTDTNQAIDRVIRYIADSMAFEPTSCTESYLDRRISGRMRRTDSEGYEQYLDVLSSDRDDRDALLDALSINVTSFFRNPPVWERLRDVLAELTAENRTVRCWSAACADRRRPCSIAMLSRDDLDIQDRAIDITATATETLTGAIVEGGFLTIGKSETLPRAFREKYEPHDRSTHIYWRD